MEQIIFSSVETLLFHVHVSSDFTAQTTTIIEIGLQGVILSDISAASVHQKHPCKGKPLDSILDLGGFKGKFSLLSCS